MGVKTLFELGFVSVTPEASLALAENGLSAQDVLDRHAVGDWGDISEQAKQRNNTLCSLKLGLRSHSAYHLPKTKHYLLSEVCVWVITESAVYALNGIKRVTTTVLMPDDYFGYKSPII